MYVCRPLVRYLAFLVGVRLTIALIPGFTLAGAMTSSVHLKPINFSALHTQPQALYIPVLIQRTPCARHPFFEVFLVEIFLGVYTALHGLMSMLGAASRYITIITLLLYITWTSLCGTKTVEHPPKLVVPHNLI